MSIPTTDTRLKALILREIGDVDPGNKGPVSSIIDALWDVYSSFANSWPMHQYYLVKIKALEVWIGSIASGRAIQQGVRNEPLDDKVAAYQKMLDDTREVLALEVAKYAAAQPAQVSTMSQTAPIMPGDSDPVLNGILDGNSRIYRGDPLIGRSPYRNRFY